MEKTNTTVNLNLIKRSLSSWQTKKVYNEITRQDIISLQSKHGITKPAG